MGVFGGLLNEILGAIRGHLGAVGISGLISGILGGIRGVFGWGD